VRVQWKNGTENGISDSRARNLNSLPYQKLRAADHMQPPDSPFEYPPFPHTYIFCLPCPIRVHTLDCTRSTQGATDNLLLYDVCSAIGRLAYLYESLYYQPFSGVEGGKVAWLRRKRRRWTTRVKISLLVLSDRRSISCKQRPKDVQRNQHQYS
jgi:hypothetical protein